MFPLKAATDLFDRVNSGSGRREEILTYSCEDHTLPYGSSAFMRMLLQKLLPVWAARVKNLRKNFFFCI